MRRKQRIARFLRKRWLEIVLLLGLSAIVYWFVDLGLTFWPGPALTPTPAATVVPAPTALSTRAPAPTTAVTIFSGAGAYQHVVAQTAFGPRPTGSEAHKETGDYIIDTLRDAGWQVQIQEFEYQGTKARNIIGKAGEGTVAIVGAHYDTRRQADNDSDESRRKEPVMGANDGASGVAVLLELAESLNQDALSHEVWLTFFDAEDNGGLDGWDFIAGSRYMAEHLDEKPELVIVADMIGDADQQIYLERNSTSLLQNKIWEVADQLGYQEHFIPEYKWSILDDHTPFLELGLAAVDLIDFDYPYWHTTADSLDKVSEAALERVGRVLQVFLEGALPVISTPAT